MKTFAGLSLDHCRIMGIVNATPDSFSDGGEAFAFEDAVRRGLQMCEDGAAIIDVGGESTRPGALPVGLDEEIRRTVPVIKRLVKAGALVSIDTRHALVMQAALDVGAKIVNDVSALTGEGAVDVVAGSDADVVLMHMQGLPKTMQDDPSYKDAPAQVIAYLKERIQVCEEAGIAQNRIAVDPGIGFGKTVDNNLDILARLNLYNDLAVPVLLGVSRKSFIGAVTDEPDAQKRLPGSIAAALFAVEQGVKILRVHDVPETLQALNIWSALTNTHT
ncbi:MAG: dihydropteroate synthase [Rhodospirillaceae bacterium]|nr:MAG: dihydropteroate synthase [Rhodospirillaceae bacterium]